MGRFVVHHLQTQAQARAQVALALSKVTPKTVNEKSKIEISGVAKNRTDDQIPVLTLRLRYCAQPVNSRSQLDQLAKGQPSALPYVRRRVMLVCPSCETGAVFDVRAGGRP